jgi:hypothetical protein
MYETKVLLNLLADSAARTKSKPMYLIIAKAANAEGVVMKPYEEAVAEIEESEK